MGSGVEGGGVRVPRHIHMMRVIVVPFRGDNGWNCVSTSIRVMFMVPFGELG